MHRRRKISGSAMGLPLGIGLAILISLIITIGGASIAALLVSTGKIGEKSIGYAVMLIQIIATVFGAWLAVRFVKRMRLQVALIFGGCYYLVLLAMTALLFGGQYAGMGASAIIIGCGSALIAFIPANTLKIRNGKKRAYR